MITGTVALTNKATPPRPRRHDHGNHNAASDYCRSQWAALTLRLTDRRWKGTMKSKTDSMTPKMSEPSATAPVRVQPAGSAALAQGVWCCERMAQCNWQGFALHQGLAWGTVPPKHEAITNDWRTWHDRECGGRLIQLLPPNDQAQRRRP